MSDVMMMVVRESESTLDEARGGRCPLGSRSVVLSEIIIYSRGINNGLTSAE